MGMSWWNLGDYNDLWNKEGSPLYTVWFGCLCWGSDFWAQTWKKYGNYIGMEEGERLSWAKRTAVVQGQRLDCSWHIWGTTKTTCVSQKEPQRKGMQRSNRPSEVRFFRSCLGLGPWWKVNWETILRFIFFSRGMIQSGLCFNGITLAAPLRLELGRDRVEREGSVRKLL